jgi:nucleoside 2-deoxyribosyltransferase
MFAFLLVQGLNLINHPHRNLWGFFVTILTINLLEIISLRLLAHHWDISAGKGLWRRASGLSLLWPFLVIALYVPRFSTSKHETGLNLIVLLIGVVAVNGRELIERKAAKVRWARYIDLSQKLRPEPAEASPVSTMYLAGPLGFSAATTEFHKRLVSEVTKKGWKVLDPWEIDPGDQFILSRKRGSDIRERNLLEVDRRLGGRNVELIDNASVVLALLDGSDVDSGTAAEIGYAYAKGKRVIGLRLDTRMSGDNEAVTVNLQVEHFLSNKDHIARTLPDALAVLGRPSPHVIT